MKSSILLGASSLALMTIGAMSLCNQTAAETKIGKVIVIVRRPTTPSQAPRTPEFNPFFAELINGYVILGSATAYGTVTVSLTSTAGDNYSTGFDTTDGAILLPISGDAGLYTLQITTPEGIQFVGEFTL